jgi:hypothetical protein
MAKRISDEQLDALLRLCEEATAPPWRVGYYTDHAETYTVETDGGVVCMLRDEDSDEMGIAAREAAERDFAFIAATRAAMPALVSELRRVRALRPISRGASYRKPRPGKGF